jgi:hypothetical protein
MVESSEEFAGADFKTAARRWPTMASCFAIRIGHLADKSLAGSELLVLAISLCYSALMPAAAITAFQRSRSSLMKAAVSAGVPATEFENWSSNFLATSG